MKYSTSITTKKDRRGKVVYDGVLCFYDDNGKRRWKHRERRSFSAARDALRKLEAEFVGGGENAVDSDRMTFEQLAEHCEKEKYCEAKFDGAGRKQAGVRDTSVYKAHLKHFKEFFGKMKVRDIKLANLRAYRNARLRTTTKRGTDVNVGTINREMNTLRAMLNEAKRNDWIMVNPFSKARPGELIRPGDETKRKITINYEQEVALIAACEGTHLEDRRHLRALLIAGVDTGCRKGELFRLKKPQLDFGAGMIREIVSYKGKDGAMLVRDVVMTARLREALLDLERNPSKKAFRRLKSGVKPSDELVFGITNNIRRSWAGACKDAGLEHLALHFHDLRHCAGTRLADVMKIVHVGKVLGHSKTETTERYVNPDETILRQAAAVLEQWQEKERQAAQRREVHEESESVN